MSDVEPELVIDCLDSTSRNLHLHQSQFPGPWCPLQVSLSQIQRQIQRKRQKSSAGISLTNTKTITQKKTKVLCRYLSHKYKDKYKEQDKSPLQVSLSQIQRQIHRQRQKSSACTFLYFAKISILTILSAFHNLKVPFRITFLLVNHSSVNRDLPSLEVARPSIPIEIAGVSIPSL